MLKDGPVRPTSSEGSSGSRNGKQSTPLSERLARAKPTGTTPGKDTNATPNTKPATGEPSLAEKLARKASAERAETEAIYTSELRRLGESLRSECESALRSTESAMRQRSSALMHEMERIERRQRLVPLWIALGSVAIVLSGLLILWGASAWANWSLNRDRAALETIRGEIAIERQQLTLLRNETRGVRTVRYGDGSVYLILPEGTEPNFECDGRTCVKLPPPVPVPNVRPRD